MRPLVSVPAALVAVALVPCITDAQERGDETRPGSERAPIEELVVTARKREERLQDVPVAVSAFTSLDIEDAGIRTVQDVAELTPGLTWTALFGSGNGAPVIRGVSTNIGETNVGFFLDGVYQSSRAAMDTLLDGIERIEVARGPQSALYGRNTFGGAINYITKRPADEFEGSVEATLGDEGRQEYRASLSGPTPVGALYYRLGAAYTTFDGFFANELDGSDLDDRESTLLSLSLEVRPNDEFDITLRAGYEDTDNGDYPLRFVANNAGFFPPLGANQVFRGELPHLEAGHAVTPGRFERENLNLSLTVDASFGDLSFTSITGWNDLAVDNRNDNDFSAAELSRQVQRLDQQEWSQELRLNSEYGGRFNWMLGAYYYELDLDTLDDNRFLSPQLDVLFSPPSGPLSVLGVGSVLLNNREATENYALFGELRFDLTGRVRLSAAGRYANEKKALDTFNSNPHTGFVLADLELEDDWDSFTPEATLDFRFSDDAMVYLRVARAIKSGGFNALANVTPAERTYDPEKSWNYELGSKTRWLDRRLTVNAAFFWIEWQDQIVRAIGASGAILNTNAAETSSKGFELEFLARPMDRVEVRGGYAYTDSEYEEYLFAALANLGLDPDVSGVALQNVSEHQGNLSLQYTQAVGPSWRWLARVDASYRSKQNAVQTGDAFVGDSTRVNLRTGFENDRLSVELWGRNVLDDDTAHSGVFVQNRGAAVAVLGGAGIQFFNALVTAGDEPSYGVTARYRF